MRTVVMGQLQVFLLGGFDLACNDQPLPRPATQKAQSLLAYTIVNRRRLHSREMLAEMFWPERPEGKARHSLNTALWHIRRILTVADLNPTDYLCADARGIGFNPDSDYWMDTDEFEQHIVTCCNLHPEGDSLPPAGCELLEKAGRLYRGDFLEGFFDDWCLVERYRLEALFVEALVRLVKAYESQERPKEALASVQRLLCHDPLREDMHRRAMRLYVQLDQPLAALEQYRFCRTTLQQELGLELSAETKALWAKLLGTRFTPEIPTLHRGVKTWPTLATPSLRGRTPFDAGRTSLVERDEELNALRSAWGETLTDHGQLALVSGEAGVGKTRLTQELAEMVRWQGGQVLWGQCYEYEHALTYGPVAEALRPFLLGLTADELETAPSWCLTELTKIVPELQERWPERPPDSPLAAKREQTRLFEAMVRFLRYKATSSPLLLVLEDLHWATEPTLEAMHYLTHHLADTRIMIVGTFREEDLESRHPLRELMRRLGKGAGAAISTPLLYLTLSRLSRLAVQKVIEEMSGLRGEITPLAQRLYEETEGNPFFLIETVKALFEEDYLWLQDGIWQGDHGQLAERIALPLPRTAEASIKARVNRLSSNAREALSLAAVAGQELDFDVLQLAWKRDEEVVLEAVDELLRRQLIREGKSEADRDYHFDHHLFREVVYAGLHRRRQQRLHRLVGEAKEATYGGEPGMAGELAHHYECARIWQQALPLLMQAAEEAVALYDYKEALDCYDRASKAIKHLMKHPGEREYYTPEATILEGQTKIYHLQARYPERQAAIHRLRELSEATGSPVLLARSLEREARYMNLDGYYNEAIERARQAVELYRESDDISGEALALAQEGFAHYFRGEYAAAMELLQAALDLKQDDRETTGEILSTLSYAHYLVSDYERSLEYRQQALAIRREIGQLARVAEDLTDVGVLLTRLSRFDEAQLYLNEALHLAETIGSQPGESYALNNTGNLHNILGDYSLALEFYQRSLALQRATGSRRGEASALSNSGMTYLRLGNHALAEEMLRVALAIDEEIGYHSGEAESLVYLGRVLFEQRDETAPGIVARAMEMAKAIGDRYSQVLALNTLAHFNLAAGNAQSGLKCAQEATDLAEEIAYAGGHIRGWVYQGLAHLAQEDAHSAYSCTTEAMALLAKCGSIEGPEEAIYFAHYRTAMACGKTDEADAYRRMARNELQSKAYKIAAETGRRSFLEHVPLSCAIERSASD